MKSQNENIRVLIFKYHDLWIAQCLEYDISAQANTLKELQDKFVCTLMAYVMLAIDNNERPFSNVPKTPKEFWKMFNKGNPLKKPLKIPSPPRRKIHGKYIKEYVPKQASLALSETPCG